MTAKSAISVSVEQPSLQPKPIPDGFVRPPHGRGLLRAPWAPGERGVPHTTRNRYAACQNMCRERSAEAADKMYSLMSCGDERIEFMAAAWIYERAWGKSKELDLRELNQGAMRLDFSKLSREEIALLLRITQSGAMKRADDG